MSFFRKSSLEPLAVSMSGVKLGDRLLVLGGSDPILTAALASKAGLTGRACALDASAEATAAAAAAVERQGVLIETFTAPWTMLPFDSDSFDVVVFRNVLGPLAPDGRAGAVREARRVLRPGGRCLVIDDAARRALAGLLGGRGASLQYASQGGGRQALESGDFRGVRTLAEREGQVFVEGTNPNP
jgi:ubiquinone/menaquinone biosynthesis C-methylase UbiE